MVHFNRDVWKAKQGPELLPVWHRLFIHSHSRIIPREAKVRVAIIRISFEEHLVYGDCPIILSSQLQTAREGEIKEIGIIGIEFKGDLLLFPALVQTPQIIQKAAKISVGTSAVVVERNSPLVFCLCATPVPSRLPYASGVLWASEEFGSSSIARSTARVAA